jgi:hypothetical protein
LVDLTGPGLARIGADARLTTGPHEQSRQWSRAIHDHPSKVDEILFAVRHDPSQKAAAIFNRAAGWTDLARRSWLTTPALRTILRDYGFALIDTATVPAAVKKGPKQEHLF